MKNFKENLSGWLLAAFFVAGLALSVIGQGTGSTTGGTGGGGGTTPVAGKVFQGTNGLTVTNIGNIVRFDGSALASTSSVAGAAYTASNNVFTAGKTNTFNGVVSATGNVFVASGDLFVTNGIWVGRPRDDAFAGHDTVLGLASTLGGNVLAEFGGIHTAQPILALTRGSDSSFLLTDDDDRFRIGTGLRNVTGPSDLSSGRKGITIQGANNANPGYVGIQNRDPTFQLHLTEEGAGSIFAMDSWGGASTVGFRRGQGTRAAPTAVSLGQNLALIDFSGADSAGTFIRAGLLEVQVSAPPDAAQTPDAIPVDLILTLCDSNAYREVSRFTGIGGRLGIGTNTPAAMLHVASNTVLGARATDQHRIIGNTTNSGIMYAGKIGSTNTANLGWLLSDGAGEFHNRMIGFTPGSVVLGVQAASGQTANLQNWMNSSAGTMASVDAYGSFALNSNLTVNGTTTLTNTTINGYTLMQGWTSTGVATNSGRLTLTNGVLDMVSGAATIQMNNQDTSTAGIIVYQLGALKTIFGYHPVQDSFFWGYGGSLDWKIGADHITTNQSPMVHSDTLAAIAGMTIGDAAGDAFTINSSTAAIPNGLNLGSGIWNLPGAGGAITSSAPVVINNSLTVTNALTAGGAVRFTSLAQTTNVNSRVVSKSFGLIAPGEAYYDGSGTGWGMYGGSSVDALNYQAAGAANYVIHRWKGSAAYATNYVEWQNSAGANLGWIGPNGVINSVVGYQFNGVNGFTGSVTNGGTDFNIVTGTSTTTNITVYAGGIVTNVVRIP